MDVTVYEVGLRDGLQNEPAFVPTSEKLQLATMLADAGLQRIELTSFVSPRWIPQLADHTEVATGAPRREGITYSALVPNQRGLHAAVDAGIHEVAIFMSASEAHSRKNINKSIDQALDLLRGVIQEALAAGCKVRGYLSTVFGCPYEGPVDPGRAHELTRQLLDAGCHELSLGDTIGVANPLQVRNFVRKISSDIPLKNVALHMHDTRGTALANVLAGLDAGITTFDAAFGGLGGCPYAPGASGNLATEDLVYMLEGMQLHTGVDLDRLIDASEYVSELVGRSLPSKVLQSELCRRRVNASTTAMHG